MEWIWEYTRGRMPVSSVEELKRRIAAGDYAIDSGEVTDLSSLATELGWFDQAHFSRDFRAVVGLTPSAYLARARS